MCTHETLLKILVARLPRGCLFFGLGDLLMEASSPGGDLKVPYSSFYYFVLQDHITTQHAVENIKRCVHANLVVCLDYSGTRCLWTTKMFQFFYLLPTKGRFHPTFLAEMRYPILPALCLAQAFLGPPSDLSDTPFMPKWIPCGIWASFWEKVQVQQPGF